MKQYFILTIIALGLTGCDSMLNGPGQQIGDPFIVGNYWVYDDTEYENGVPGDQIEDSIAVVTRGVMNQLDKITFNNGMIYCKGNAGIYDQDFCVLYFKYPVFGPQPMFTSALVNMKLKWGLEKATIVTTVESVDVPITVPAGKFLANKYRYQIITESGKVAYNVIRYFAPTIGIIKTELYEAPDATSDLVLVSVTELKRFQVK